MSHPPSRFRLSDYPDPIVAEFLRRVSLMTPEMRRVVEGPTAYDPLTVRSLGLTRRALGRIIAWSSEWIGIRSATYGASEVARNEYNRFWRRLRAYGWESPGLAQVALSLQVVRFRVSKGYAQRLYSARLARFVPPTSIGWPEGEALVASDPDPGQGRSERYSDAIKRRATLRK
jgi:hypothetical protein